MLKNRVRQPKMSTIPLIIHLKTTSQQEYVHEINLKPHIMPQIVLYRVEKRVLPRLIVASPSDLPLIIDLKPPLHQEYA